MRKISSSISKTCRPTLATFISGITERQTDNNQCYNSRVSPLKWKSTHLLFESVLDFTAESRDNDGLSFSLIVTEAKSKKSYNDHANATPYINKAEQIFKR